MGRAVPDLSGISRVSRHTLSDLDIPGFRLATGAGLKGQCILGIEAQEGLGRWGIGETDWPAFCKCVDAQR